MKVYAKAIAAILGAVSTWGITAAADNAITMVEWFGLLGAMGTAVAVWAVPNAAQAVAAAGSGASSGASSGVATSEAGMG